MTFLRLLAATLLTAACGVSHSHDKLGANLNFIGDFRRNHEFVDVVKQSRKFLKIGQFDDQQAANLAPVGPEGWPSTDFRLFAMAAQQGTLALAGTYKIVFTGSATLTIPGGGSGSIQNKTTFAGITRADLVFPAGAENMIIDFTATGGSVRDLRIIRPGYDADVAPLLHLPWTSHVGRFSVLRFLDWTRTNGNRAVTWNDRTQLPGTEAYIARWETVADAANALGRDAWINIPVQANDEYVTNLATLMRDRLNPSLNLYVEYGNELWNFSIRDTDLDTINGGVFNGATVNRSLAAASPANSKLRFDGTSDQDVLGFRRVALRLKEISDIFKTVWGPTAINTRVRPVLAGQMANSFILTEGLRLIDEGLNIRPDTVIYAISGAPYVFPAALPDGNADETPGMTTAQILAGIADGVANAPAQNAYQYLTYAGLGAWYGLKVVAYEAGFDNFGAQNIAAKRAANLDPQIRTLCKSLVDQWHAFGFEHLMWFNAGADSYQTQFGMWPLMEDISGPDSPKDQCMDDVMLSALPAITAGTSVATPIAGGNFRGSTSPGGSLTGLASPFGFPGYVEYLVRAGAAGTYDIVFRGNAPAGETFRVKLNNGLASDSVTVPTTIGDSTALRVTLRAGLNALRIERNGSGASWSVESFTFTLIATSNPLSTVSSVPFGGQSMQTTTPPKLAVISNVGNATLDVGPFFVTGPYALTHNCTTLAPGASCSASITFTPVGEGSQPGVLQVGSGAGSLTIPLSGTGERSLVTHYYRSILRRDPDNGGKSFWTREAARVTGLGVDVNETWYSLAIAFYTSDEYTAFGRTDRGFVTDLYTTFFNRAPDGGGLNYWVGQLAGGMPRGVVLVSFMFSPEFVNFTRNIFGDTAVRSEINTVVDFYRGLLERLPDQGGFSFWVQRFRAAQCSGGQQVLAEVEAISSGFADSPEYQALNRSNGDFVGDLYNAFLRRGGDLDGVLFWVNQLATGARTRSAVRQAFIQTPEFNARVSALLAQGCIN